MFELDFILTVELSIFGIGVTIFTVLYSFILNKKTELSVYTDIKRKQKVSTKTILDQKITFAERYISNTKLFNSYLLILIFSSFAVAFLSFLLIIIENHLSEKLSDGLNIVLSFLAVITFIYILILLIAVVRRYIKEVKIK